MDTGTEPVRQVIQAGLSYHEQFQDCAAQHESYGWYQSASEQPVFDFANPQKCIGFNIWLDPFQLPFSYSEDATQLSPALSHGSLSSGTLLPYQASLAFPKHVKVEPPSFENTSQSIPCETLPSPTKSQNLNKNRRNGNTSKDIALSCPANGSIPRARSDTAGTEQQTRKRRFGASREASTKNFKPTSKQTVVCQTSGHRMLERNRIAATKCRLRKRDEASALADQEQDMEEENHQLRSHRDTLVSQVLHLKTLLLDHTDCNCYLIQKYIASQAEMAVESLPSLVGSPITSRRTSKSASSDERNVSNSLGYTIKLPKAQLPELLVENPDLSTHYSPSSFFIPQLKTNMTSQTCNDYNPVTPSNDISRGCLNEVVQRVGFDDRLGTQPTALPVGGCSLQHFKRPQVNTMEPLSVFSGAQLRGYDWTLDSSRCL